MKEKFFKVIHFLNEFDFLWSLPFAFVAFILFPIFGQFFFGEGFGFYSPSFFHAGIYAGLIGILFNSMTQMFIFFSFPKQYKHYLQEGFETQPEWLKVFVFLFLYVFCFSSLLIIWSQVV